MHSFSELVGVQATLEGRASLRFFGDAAISFRAEFSHRRLIVSMRVVIQRVSSASVTISNQSKAAIASGMLILLGIEEGDGAEDIEWLCGKLVRIRIFNDEQGVMNRSVQETSGDILVVSQFTLYASTRKGNRPSYIRAARPGTAIPIYEMFLNKLTAELGKPVPSGEFGADMQVALVNDGPVTILIDTKARE